MSDLRSDMKTFTVRQLDRETARVMEACDTYGSVRIRRRDGRTYTLQTDRNGEFSLSDWLAERLRKSKALFGDQPPLTKKQLREFEQLIRSDREI